LHSLTTAAHALVLKGDALPKMIVNPTDERDMIAEVALIAEGS
jgi:hypothetical protein